MEIVVGGDLLDKFIVAESYTEDKVAHIIHQVMLALNHMHLQKIAHRDIKLENIMCTQVDLQNFDVKLCDFGFAVF